MKRLTWPGLRKKQMTPCSSIKIQATRCIDAAVSPLAEKPWTWRLSSSVFRGFALLAQTIIPQLVGNRCMGDAQALAQLPTTGMFGIQTFQHGLFKPADDGFQAALQREIAKRLTHAIVRQTNVFSLDRPALTQRNRLEQDVFQLPYIARPVVMAESLHGRRSQFGQRAADLPAGLIEEVFHQRRQAIEAFAQRRDMERQHVQAAIKVLKEFAPRAEVREGRPGWADQ